MTFDLHLLNNLAQTLTISFPEHVSETHFAHTHITWGCGVPFGGCD